MRKEIFVCDTCKMEFPSLPEKGIVLKLYINNNFAIKINSEMRWCALPHIIEFCSTDCFWEYFDALLMKDK